MRNRKASSGRFWLRFLLVWLLAVFLVGLYWARLELSYRHQITEAEQTARLRADEAAHSLAMQSLSQLRSIDFIVAYMGDLWQKGDQPAFRRLVQSTAGFLSENYLRLVAVTDAEGNVLFTHFSGKQQGDAPVGLSLSDREYFQQHRRIDGKHFSISAPVRNKLTGDWTIQYSHSLIRDHKFDGLVLASISVRHLSEAFLSVYPEPEDVVFLALNTGEYLTRNHHLEHLMQAPALPEHGFMQQPSLSKGFYDLKLPNDGVQRQYAWYRMQDYPVVLSLGLGREKLLRPVQESIRQSRQHNLAGAALLLLGLGWALLLLQHKNEQHQQLMETRERLFTLLRHFPAGVLLENERGRVVTANRRFCHMMGLNTQADRLTNMRHDKLLELMGEERARWLPMPDTYKRLRQRIEVEVDEGCYFEVHWIPIRRNRQALGQFWLVVDISEGKRREGELEQLASTDSLTGLPNRRSFLRFLEQAGNTVAIGDSQALLMLDIDHFKQVNDTWGHPVGDQVLQTVADAIRTTLRKEDRAGRLGGEEFGVLLASVDREQAKKLAERLRQRIAESETRLDNGDALAVTISIGLCMLEEQTAAECLVQADQALYAAKAAGRNRVCQCGEP